MSKGILVAGIGNVFLGDDAFGVEVIRRLGGRDLGKDVTVADYGIRGFDLAYALMDDYEMAILVDALPRGAPPGTLVVLEPDLETGRAPAAVEGHVMNPMAVFALVSAMGGKPCPVRIVGCEPQTLDPDGTGFMGLSDAVEAALPGAVELVESLVNELRSPVGKNRR